MFNSSPSGFYKAPVTKGIVTGTVAISLLASILNWKKYLHLQLFPHIASQYQFWRLFVSQLAFGRSGEVLVGSLLLYQFRLLERLYGPTKYASFLVFSAILSTALQCCSLMVGRSSIQSIPPGPYATIFSALFQFYQSVPAVYSYRVGRVPIGDKSIVYALAFQLLLMRSPESLVAASCGLVAGMFYSLNIGGVKKWRVPDIIIKLFSHYFLPLVKAMPPPRTNFPTRPGTESPTSDANQTPEMDPAAAVRETISSTLGEETLGTNSAQVDELQQMFVHLPRERIVRALALSNNDLNRAATALLE